MPRIVQINKLGSAEELELKNLPLKSPGPEEVRITVKAFGVQRADVLWREGNYIQQPDGFPSGLGYDCVGVIDAVGENVSGYTIGNKVFSIPSFSLNDYTVYGESAIVHQDSITKLPNLDFSWAEYAAIIVPFYTAYFPLFEIANIRDARFVLVSAASSSTGVAAIQLAKCEGTKVIATTRTRAKAEALRELGADFVIVSDEEDLLTRIEEITEGQGLDIVFDPVGGKFVEVWYQVMRRGGHIIHYGLLDLESPSLPLLYSMMNAVTFKSYMIFEFTGNKSLGLSPRRRELDRAHQYIYGRLESGALKPIISKTFKLEDVRQSHEYMESNEQLGKIVVTVD